MFLPAKAITRIPSNVSIGISLSPRAVCKASVRNSPIIAMPFCVTSGLILTTTGSPISAAPFCPPPVSPTSTLPFAFGVGRR